MEKIITWTIIGILVAFSCIPLFHVGLHPTHDGEYHVVRFYEFTKVIKYGDLYPRWASDLNYGYGVPLFNFVYPFPNYIAFFLNLFEVSFIDAFKLNLIIASFVGAYFFYLWAKDFWGNIGGIVSAIFYVYSPYRFVDIYIRGSVGEVWALAFFPAFAWSLTNCLKTYNKKFFFLSVIFLSFLIFSHNILGLMFFGFSLWYALLLIIFSSNKKKSSLITIAIFLLGLCITSIFWLPALAEKEFVTGLEVYSVADNFAEIYELLFPSWGSGFSNGDLHNKMSLQIGIANLFAVAASIIVLIKRVKERVLQKRLLAFFLFWFVLVFFLMTRKSYILWESIPLMNYFQFPWRFLSLMIVICSFLAGSIFYKTQSKIFAFLLILLALVFSFSYTKIPYYLDRNDNYYISKTNFIDGTNSPGNYFNTIWFDKNLKKQAKKITDETSKAVPNFINPTHYNFSVEINENKTIVVNTAYFPGWTAYADGKKLKTEPSRDGRISFSVPWGTRILDVKLTNTTIQKTAEIISFVSILVMFLLLRTRIFS